LLILVTFRERFCQKYKIPDDKYERVAMRHALYPHARLVWWLVTLDSQFDTADIEFIRCIGRTARLREYENEALDYRQHPRNDGFLRKRLKLRVSVARFRRVVRAVLREESTSPFPATNSSQTQ
jgi:hypothetical protein